MVGCWVDRWVTDWIGDISSVNIVSECLEVEKPAQPRAQPRVQPRIQPRAQPRVQPRIQPRVQPRVQPRIQPRAQPRVQPRAQHTQEGDTLIGSLSDQCQPQIGLRFNIVNNKNNNRNCPIVEWSTIII